MIRTLFIIAGAATVLALASIAGAMALGGADLRRHDWSWTFRDDDGDNVRIERIRGGAERGPDVTRDLEWSGSDRLSVEIPGDVIFIQGTETKVTVTGARTAVERVRLENGRLWMADGEERITLGWRHGEITGWSDNDDLRVTITAPSVSRFDLSGSGSLSIRDYDQPRLAVDISGSGEVDARGRAPNLSVEVSGSGEADLAGLETRDASIAIAGSGDVTAGPTGRADIEIDGSGDVRLTRRPADLHQSVSGSGDIRVD